MIAAEAVVGLLLPFVMAAYWRAITRRFKSERWYGWPAELSGAAVFAVIGFSVWRIWPAVCSAGVVAVVCAAIWWYRRKKRRSGAALIGEKSRQLRAALVRRARQSARPSPVLKPSLRGA